MPADLRSLSSTRQLADLTYATEQVVADFLAAPREHVDRIVIPRHGPSRAPREAWKVKNPDVRGLLNGIRWSLEAFLLQWFSDRYPSPWAHGYVRDRSALTNARLHAGHRVLLHVDVENFFPSITIAAVRDALLRLELKADGAQLLSRVLTLDDKLPLGFPTSPLLSNIVFNDADCQLAALAASVGATYTRYADDLTFSGNGKLPTSAEVADVLRGLGLAINQAKTRLKKRGQALYVTGYSVSDPVARAPRPLKRRLRQDLYFIRKHGLVEHLAHRGRGSVTAEYDRIVGRIEHVRYAEPAIGEAFLEQWLARPTQLDGSLVRAPVETGTPVVLLFDDTAFTFGGTDYRALGAVLLRDHKRTTERVQELIAEFMLNPIMPEHARDHVREKGLHFNRLPPDFRRDAIELAARVPARAHVVFDAALDTKKAQMVRFVRAALKWRLRDCHARSVTVVFEQGEYIRQTDARALVDAALLELPQHDRPLRIEDVQVVGKLDEPCLALADIFLGAWQQFACSRDPQRSGARDRDELLFRSLQRRLGTVYRISTHQLFTARSPFNGLEPMPPPPGGGSTPSGAA